MKYNEKYEFNPNGFVNLGATCYFNSLVQGLMSCTQLTETILEMDDRLGLSPVLSAYKQMLLTVSTGDVKTAMQSVVPLWKTLISELRKSGNKTFGSGQEDSSEALTLILQSMNSFMVDYLFEHKYERIIFCHHCNKICSRPEDTSIIYEVHYKDLTPHGGDLNRYILNHRPPMDESYICPKCNKAGKKTQAKQLVVIPEIFVVQYNKYESKWPAAVPTELKIPTTDGSYMKYILVSQTLHSGSQRGGHYWAYAKRAGGVFNLNDTSVSKADFSSLNQTVLLWYVRS